MNTNNNNNDSNSATDNERTWTIACIDGSKFNSSVCDYSVWLSRQLSAPFKALHAIEHAQTAAAADFTGAIGLGAQEHLMTELTELEQQRNRLEMQKGRQMLDTVRARASGAGISEVVGVQRHGTLIETLIELEHSARVIVVGIRGESHQDDQSHLGGHLESLVRSVRRPIFVVNREFSEPKSVMLAYDGSECSNKALDMVASSPLFDTMPVHVVHVAEEESKGQAVLESATNKLKAAGRNVSSALLGGEPTKALCDYQENNQIDMTAMGAFSHNRLRDLVFGSFTAKMLLGAHKPLLLLR